ncbi:conserved hypothetical protein [Carnobacterium maltaromaticum]|uniref:hypothetical protein n=1 Tax=Carnobacterium maltaromaticum TaxID=2751 RepID=UPI0007049ABE|nr:hypothetical protein [Carnobacterium maltaromaticum]MBC9787216.1 hypothetical protein [Carnobacterium maltaromaticum]CRH18865.1 conserved hypothetical protein [Carnobacterium maltaromaticum]
MDTMTKDAKYLLAVIYKEYLLDINNGVSKNVAKQIGSSETINNKLVPDKLFDDVDETMRELERSYFLENFYADDVVYQSTLTDKSIVYMETKLVRGLKDMTEFLLKLK